MLSMELKDDRSEKVRYDYTDYPIYIRRALLSGYANYAAPSHWHDDIEFIVVLSGEMQYNINGQVITLSENQGVFINTRQMHFGFSAKKTECDFLCILLHPMMLCGSYACERDFVLPVLHASNAPYGKLDPGVPWQNDILESIRAMYAARDSAAAPVKVQSLFLGIWAQLYENLPSAGRVQHPNGDLSVVRNMMGFIQQNYATKITLAEIAAAGAVGQSKCCKLFARYVGQTPNGYLTQYRLDKSTFLLRNTDQPVTEIAAAVGFGGSSYYAEIFRKWYGKSPSEYRQGAISNDR